MEQNTENPGPESAGIPAGAINEKSHARHSMILILATVVVLVAIVGLSAWLLGPRSNPDARVGEVRFVKPAESPVPVASAVPASGVGAAPLASPLVDEGTSSPLELLATGATAQPAHQTQSQELVLIVDGQTTQVKTNGTVIHVGTATPAPEATPAPPAPAPSAAPAAVLGNDQTGPAPAVAASTAKPRATPAPKAPGAPKATPKPVSATRPKDPVVPSSAKGATWWIQVISTPNRDRVDQVRSDLAALGFKGRVTSREVNGTDFYRLRYGPYANKDEARKFLEWVKMIKGFEESYISQEPAAN